MTGHIYPDVILEQHVRWFRGAMGAECLFMDDNARPHRANIVDECLQSKDITRMYWPAYSPDLNPIEHISFVNPTPLAHADTSRDVLPRGGTSHWRPTRFNLYDPEMRNARGFNVWPEVYFSRSSPGESPKLVPNIRISVRAKYRHGLRAAEAALSKALPAIQNRKDFETRFYASQQRQNKEPTDFV
ncbi:DDE_3 domain-containing protein [Trichonephila clavipes]|nr:DDE_3 domain-containing protein [Trichonephila clavipes]